MSDDKALVLFSGGQDSTTCLFWAIRQFEKVMAVGFDYGQRHQTELAASAGIAAGAGIPFRVFKIDTLTTVSKNALTDTSLEIEKPSSPGHPPNTLVEGRNLLFLTFAAIYARQQGISNLVTGVGQTDYSNYPDCRNDFIRSANQTLNLAFDHQFVIHAPLMWKTKAMIWEMADELGIFELVRQKTITCYNGITGEGCGQCPSCILRKRGLDEYDRQKSNSTV